MIYLFGNERVQVSVKLSGRTFCLQCKPLRQPLPSFNLLPHLPILGPPNSAANKDMMSKVWANGETII